MDKTIRVVICDDEKTAASILGGSIQSMLTGGGFACQIQKFLSPTACEAWLSDHPSDLLLLDISMPEEDGIRFAERMRRELKNMPALIFVSSKEERVFESMDVQPFGFVRKEHFLEDLSRVLDRFMEEIRSGKKDNSLLEIEDGSGIQVFPVADICYLESFRNLQTIHLQDGSTKDIYSTMSVLTEKLEPCGFLRVHRSYLVACREVRGFDREAVMLLSGEKLPVGRSYYKEAVEKYMNYIRQTGAIAARL